MLRSRRALGAVLKRCARLRTQACTLPNHIKNPLPKYCPRPSPGSC